MGSLTLLYALGHGDRCIIEKSNYGWRLRIWHGGRTLDIHPVNEELIERLLSARTAPRLIDLLPEDRLANPEALPSR
jgi:hypothetical protein